MPINLKLGDITEAQLAAAHERWYARQPFTRCQRCDREFPNLDHGKTNYCSQECEIGYFQAKPEEERKRAKPKGGRKRNLGYSSFRSKWS